MHTPPAVTSLTHGEMVRFLGEKGLPRFRADQLFAWVYRRRVDDFALMTDLPAALREDLASWFSPPREHPGVVSRGEDGSAKLEVCLGDGASVEAVLMQDDDRNTLCLSSQVGCALGCAFCRTGTMGFSRHLETGEMVAQYRLAQALLPPDRDRIHNLVFMGMGEPLLNLDNVVSAIDIFTCRQGLFISPHKITVSTAGVADAIPDFAARCRADLAVSLNATTDELRSRLMPINRKYPLAVLTARLKQVEAKRRRDFTLEYVMLSGVNDTPEDSHRLGILAKSLEMKVNLIPFNAHDRSDFRGSGEAAIDRFCADLARSKVTVTVRRSRGRDIHAACGMLARPPRAGAPGTAI